MDSPDIDNQTDFEVHPQLFLDRRGERLLVVVKATFLLPSATRALELAPPEWARPIRMADEPWGEPEVDSIRYPSDICGHKPGTDVIVVASAYAPNQVPVPEFDAYVRVGALRKAVRVFGLRVWESQGGGLSRARPIDRLDVRYDFAWGGRDETDPSRVVEEPRNPVGRGVAKHADALTHQLGPQIEDPDALIRSASTRPAPAGLGALGRSFAPRRDHRGTYDDAWKNFRAPLPPTDEKDEMALVASPGLSASPPLVGGEECALLNLSPAGPVAFVLPRVRLELGFEVLRRPDEIVQPFLDTVLIDTWNTGPEKPAVLEMVWRGSVPAPRRMKDAHVTVSEL